MRRYDIAGTAGLDPVIALIEAPRPGACRLIVQCWDRAWHGYWGAIGEATPEQFITKNDPQYIAGNLMSGLYGKLTKIQERNEEKYLARIITVVQEHLRTHQPKVEEAQ